MRLLGQESPGLLREIKQHGAGFEDRDRRAAAHRFGIDQGWNPVVRRDLEEFRLELLAGTDLHRNDAIGHPGFLEKHRDFVPVGSRPVVKVDHIVFLSRNVSAVCSRPTSDSIYSERAAAIPFDRVSSQSGIPFCANVSFQ